MKKIYIFAAFIILIQFVQIERENPNIESEKELNVSIEIKEILKKSCFDCHSNETNYPFYSYIAPFSWFMARNISKGRESLNFSNWGDIEPQIKKARLERMSKVIKNDFMPKKEYVWLHPESKLSSSEKDILMRWAKDILK